MQAPYPCRIGYTDYISGVYFNKDLRTDARSDQAVENLVFASAVTPLIMDCIRLQRSSGAWTRLSDGGLRHVVTAAEVAALAQSLVTQGAPPADVSVSVFVCSPAVILEWIIGTFKLSTEIRNLGGRVEVYQNPTEYLTNSITSFTPADVSSMLQSGYDHGASHFAGPIV